MLWKFFANYIKSWACCNLRNISIAYMILNRWQILVSKSAVMCHRALNQKKSAENTEKKVDFANYNKPGTYSNLRN